MKREAMGLIVKRDDGSEVVNYDNAAFPSYIYGGWVVKKATWEKVPHFHEDLEFVTVTSGKMAYSVNGKTVFLQEGDTIMVNSNQIHYSIATEDEVARYVIFVVHPSILMSSVTVEMQAVRPIIDNPEIPYLLFRGYNEYAEEMRKLMKPLPDLRHDAFAVTLKLFQLWEIVRKQVEHYMHTEEETVSDPKMQMVKTMLFYISEHYAEKVKLEEIAESAHISKSLCNSLFQQYVEESPINYLMHFRCRKVAEYLRSSSKTLTEISVMTGFNGVSYMSETFRKFFDSSPAAYRKQWAKLPEELKDEKKDEKKGE